MELYWPVLVTVMVVNDLWVGTMILAQVFDKSLLPRHSLVPGTGEKVLHIVDFQTMTWGDLFGVPLIVNAFVHLAMQDIANLWWALPIIVVSGVAFAKACLGKYNTPNYGPPNFKNWSPSDMLHAVYFGTGIGATVVCLWNLFVTGDLPWTSPVTCVALIGAAFYGVCFAADKKAGKL